MKRTIIIMLIAMLVGGLLMSCSSEMRSKESLYSISVSDASEKALSTNASNLTEVSVESLYWYYSATKTSGPFTHGKTEFSAVKDGTGLAGADLGQFSNGGWTFVFKGYQEEVESFTDTPVYECTTTFTLSANLNLDLVLTEGAGMPGNGFKLGNIEMLGEDMAYPLSSKLSVYEGENLLLGPISTFETDGVDQDGKIHFTSDEVVPLSVGNHTLVFKVHSNTRGQGNELVGSAEFLITVAKGVTQTIGGSIDDKNGQSAITVTAFSHIYKVTFNVNGGDALQTSWKNVYEGQTYGELPTPTKTDDTFAGWYTAQTGGTLVTAESDVAINDNHTLYARWSSESVDYANTLTFTVPYESMKFIVDGQPSDTITIGTNATTWGGLDGQACAASWNMYSDGEVVVNSFTVTGFSVLTFNIEGDEVPLLTLPSTSTGNGKIYLCVADVTNNRSDPVALDANIDFTKTYYVVPTEYMPVEESSSITIHPLDEDLCFVVDEEHLSSIDIEPTGTTWGDMVGQPCTLKISFWGESTAYEYGLAWYSDEVGQAFAVKAKDSYGYEMPFWITTSDVENPGYEDVTFLYSTDSIDLSKTYYLAAPAF